MSLEKKPQQIFYIGKKPLKHDTVAGTGVVWAGFGDSHLVPHSSAVLLKQHPDVWVDAQVFAEKYGELHIEHSEETSPGLSNVSANVEPQNSVANELSDETQSTPNVNAPALPESEPPKVPEVSGENSNPVNDRIAMVINAIVTLDKSNPEHFSPQTGNPIVKAVREAAADNSIEVKEVNAAWKALNTKKAG